MLELKSKSVYRQNLGSLGSLSGILWGFKNTNFGQFLSIFTVFRPPSNPHSMSLLTPNFVCRHFFDFNSSIFYFQIISRSFKTEKSQFSHIDTLYEARFCCNLFIKLSDPLLAHFKWFLRSECTKGSRIPKYLPWRGGICGQIIFAK